MTGERRDEGAGCSAVGTDAATVSSTPNPLPIPGWVWHGTRVVMLVGPLGLLAGAVARADYQEATTATAMLLYMVFLYRNPQLLLGKLFPDPEEDAPWHDVEIAWLALGLLGLGWALF